MESILENLKYFSLYKKIAILRVVCFALKKFKTQSLSSFSFSFLTTFKKKKHKNRARPYGLLKNPKAQKFWNTLHYVIAKCKMCFSSVISPSYHGLIFWTFTKKSLVCFDCFIPKGISLFYTYQNPSIAYSRFQYCTAEHDYV